MVLPTVVDACQSRSCPARCSVPSWKPLPIPPPDKKAIDPVRCLSLDTQVEGLDAALAAQQHAGRRWGVARGLGQGAEGPRRLRRSASKASNDEALTCSRNSGAKGAISSGWGWLMRLTSSASRCCRGACSPWAGVCAWADDRPRQQPATTDRAQPTSQGDRCQTERGAAPWRAGLRA